MSGSSKSKTGFWYGYLEAGSHSSPVMRDPQLETGNDKTLYLFNLARRKILEYQREIVEAKLRDLKPAEKGAIAELDAAYPDARRNFNGRANRSLSIPEAAAPAVKARKPVGEEELEALPDDDGDWIGSDDD